MTGTLHGAENLSSLDVDFHDATGQSVVGQVLDVVAMGDDPHLVLRRDEEILRRQLAMGADQAILISNDAFKDRQGKEVSTLLKAEVAVKTGG